MPTNGSGPNKIYNFGLRAKTIGELRVLAQECIAESSDYSRMNKSGLIAVLSEAAGSNAALAERIGQVKITIKPSFYLMMLGLHQDAIPDEATAMTALARALNEENASLEQAEKDPVYKGFQVNGLMHEDKRIEVRFTWQTIHWYWSPEDVVLKPIYELQFGFALLDFNTNQAMLICHTHQERNILARALAETYQVELTPMELRKSLLNQIGSFDQVKRAGYLRGSRDPSLPDTVIYADENLSGKAVVQEMENAPNAERKQSFYHIPLTSVLECGVGVTSDSGKLWIPKEISLDDVVEYGYVLLGKIKRRITALAEGGQHEEAVRALGFHRLPAISELGSEALRSDAARLATELINMIVNREESRPFRLSPEYVVRVVPDLFYYPRLQLEDPETHDYAFWEWRDADAPGRESLFVKPQLDDGRLSLSAFPSGAVLDTVAIPHPTSGASVNLVDPLGALYLLPQARLQQAMLEAVRLAANQLNTTKLPMVANLEFWISGHTLHLNLDRSLGRAGLAPIGSVLEPAEAASMRAAMLTNVPATEVARVRERLNVLGEKCLHMSDANCRSCLDMNKYLCLRSLVARYLQRHLLLAHKGIELSDIQGHIVVDDEDLVVFGFAKLAKAKEGLTARNGNGSILLSQVLNQIDKGTFNTAVIISPSTLNEDLRNLLRYVCGLSGKRLMFLDEPALSRMLVHFEEQATIDGLDYQKMYVDSRTRKRVSSPKKTAKTTGARREAPAQV
jgi:hypothetical protein